MGLFRRPSYVACPCLIWTAWLLFAWAHGSQCMTTKRREELREDARYIFYHGLDNYHEYAYPEDELRPLTCGPLTRDRANPAHIEVNDVLGNYSLSVVDSLSTLAILASSPTSPHDDHNALLDFQRYTSLLVDEYGDGTNGSRGRGRRAKGFDLDSKVQVFETTIRGVGGLLSAHLFAVGDLPIRGYHPRTEHIEDGTEGIRWSAIGSDGNQFVYNGQLLRLAYDLAERLLPAFHTPTGLPYPRVNLRHGTPFYENSPLNNDAEHGQCGPTQVPKTEREVTETCSAGAGSLVLEFTTLSRLTGDDRFETLAKRAFGAIWSRRSAAGLIGSGIDAETGQWISPYTGIGAGIDSFFEYSIKSHILLSGLPDQEDDEIPAQFLQAWQDAHAAIRRHIYRGPQYQHPHYAQNDMWTGGPRLAWIDSLSAYYPGLLALAGEIEEATTTHLFYAALWQRYGALPERWNTFTGKIDAGLRWWGGRPEFIESTWYLYQATHDPWYLHVGEMTISDIKRRCYTPCGWAGLQDVRTGEQSDRMESFFLGETAKYLYLLFDPDHPLNRLDAPFVFTTEGHPLIIPRRLRQSSLWSSTRNVNDSYTSADPPDLQCSKPPSNPVLSGSAVAARHDLFHAAALARLHQMPVGNVTSPPGFDYAKDHPMVTDVDEHSPMNYSFYPWTLSQDIVPQDGFSAKMALRQTFDLTFPSLPNIPTDMGALQRVDGGIMVNSVSGLRFGLLLDNEAAHGTDNVYRIYALSNLALGRDENIWLSPNVVSQLSPGDPHLARMKDIEMVDLIVDAPAPEATDTDSFQTDDEVADLETRFVQIFGEPALELDLANVNLESPELLLKAFPQVSFQNSEQLVDHLESLGDLNLPTINIENAVREALQVLREQNQMPPPVRSTPAISSPTSNPQSASFEPPLLRYTIPAALPSGPGAATLPLSIDSSPDPSTLDLAHLPYQKIYLLDSTLCTTTLPPHVAKNFNILIVRRGGCSFSAKLENIPSFSPSPSSSASSGLQLVIIVSFDAEEDLRARNGGARIRPLFDKVQVSPKGVERRNPIPAVMVGGGEETWDVLRRAASVIAIERQGEVVEVEGKEREDGVAGGIGIKRRFWFACQGIRIANLFAQ